MNKRTTTIREKCKKDKKYDFLVETLLYLVCAAISRIYILCSQACAHTFHFFSVFLIINKKFSRLWDNKFNFCELLPHATLHYNVQHCEIEQERIVRIYMAGRRAGSVASDQLNVHRCSPVVSCLLLCPSECAPLECTRRGPIVERERGRENERLYLPCHPHHHYAIHWRSVPFGWFCRFA